MEEIEKQALILLRFFADPLTHKHETAFGMPLGSLTNLQFKTLSQRVFIADVAHSLLAAESTATQRSVYYRSLTSNGGLFPSQACVNSQVQALSDSLGIDSRALGLFSTSKGLIATANEGTVASFGETRIKLCEHPDGVVISDQIARASVIKTTSKCVLIIEKDTAFQHIVSRWSFMESSQIILVTAKGFPDRSTIDLLKVLYREDHLSFFYVGDLDPFGISIYLNYVKKVVVADAKPIKWLGVRAGDVQNIERAMGGIKVGLPLKDRDFSLLENLRTNVLIAEFGLVDELDLLQDGRTKYEVECLHVLGEEFLLTWLKEKLVFF